MGGISSFTGNLTGGIIGTSDTEAAVGAVNAISKEEEAKILAEIDAQWSDIEGWMTPYLEEGDAALSEYKTNIGLAPEAPVFEDFSFSFDDYEQSDAYQFLLDTGTTAVDRAAAVNRGLTSGNRMTALADYTTGLASQEYGNEFGRQLSTYNTNMNTGLTNYGMANDQFNQKQGSLWDVASMGFNTSNNLSTLRQNTAQMTSNTYSDKAAADTAATLLPATEKSSFVNSLISGGSTIAGASMMAPKPA